MTNLRKAILKKKKKKKTLKEGCEHLGKWTFVIHYVKGEKTKILKPQNKTHNFCHNCLCDGLSGEKIISLCENNRLLIIIYHIR